MKKEKAIKLRKQGMTYNEISRRLNVAKGTLSYWFKSLNFNDKVKRDNYNKAQKIWSESITNYNLKRAKEARQRNLEEQKKATSSIVNLTTEQLKLIGTALYWAEGYKKTRWNVIFSNSDAEMIKIMMVFFQKTCKVPLSKIKGQVQLHPNVSNYKSICYWSKISGIPSSQFRKPLVAISKSSKGRRKINTLPYGTFRIIINDVHVVNLVKGWIDGIIDSFSKYDI